MKNTYVYSKDVGTLNVQQTLELNVNETITSASIGTVTPSTTNPVIVSGAAVSPQLSLTINGGQAGTSYGFPVTVVTNQRTFVVTIAVAVLGSGFNPYLNSEPGSYQDLVGDIEAGKTALATAIFQFDSSVDPSGGLVVWDLLDDQGTVYSSGNAFDYKVNMTGVSSIVITKCLITIPSSIPATVDNPYQIRYTLRVDDLVAYQYENISVYGSNEIQIGAQDSIELQGDAATLSLVTEQLFANYVLEIYQGNTLLASAPVPNPERISNGYYVAGSFDTTPLPASLMPYSVVWKFWNVPAQTFREAASLWIVTPSIIQAIEDIKSKINKARQTLYGTADSQFPSTEVLKWMRRGMDAFNGAYGVFTSFTMTNAMGPVREFWLIQSEIMALQSQYMLEGEKAFQFQGAAISLDVDRTSMIDSMASKLQSQLDNELKVFKQNLVIKGNTSGDGSGDGTGNFNKTQKGAMGSVGILITPASLFGGYLPYIPR